MSLIANCLGKLVKAGRITQKAADDALALHEGLQGRLYPSMGPATADAAGALEAARVMAQAAQRKRLTAAKQAIRHTQVLDRMKRHDRGMTAGLFGALVRDVYEDGGVGETLAVEPLSEAIMKRLMRISDDLVSGYERGLLGRKSRDVSLWNLADEAFGKDTGDDAAKAAWKGFDAANAYAVKRYIREGGNLSAKEDWRLPQFWDSRRVRRRFTEREFLNDAMRFVESGEIIVKNKDTGTAATGAAVPGIIQNARKDIALGIGGTGPGGGFRNQMRVFNFQSAEAYKFMMKKYGHGDRGLYGALLGHFHSISREMAFTEVLGPNYDANFRSLFGLARRDAAERGLPVVEEGEGRLAFAARNTLKSVKKGPGALVVPFTSIGGLRRTYQYLSGATSEVASDQMAAILGGVRAISTAARLGSATISAVPGDSVTAALTARHNGIPAYQLLKRHLRDMTVNRRGAKRLAAQLNLTAHSAIDAAYSAKRFEDELVGSGAPQAIASGTMRLSWLHGWTEGLKRTFSIEMTGKIAREAGRKFENIDPELRDFLRRYGFTPAEWDELRASPQIEAEGARFFDVNAVENERLGDRLMTAILSERQFAVIEPDARVRNVTTAGAPRGTPMGEIARIGWMFKSFPMTIMTTHMMRNAIDGRWLLKPHRLAAYLGLTALAGAVISQTQQIITGKDPQSMDDPRFWLQAIVRGGGLGFYGDFFYSAETRGELGVYEGFAGPVGGSATRALVNTAQGKWDGRQMARFVKDWTPGSTLWYARLAADRWVFDNIQALADPDYRKSFRRYEKRLKKQFGQEFWWGPGRGLPERAPEFSRAIGG